MTKKNNTMPMAAVCHTDEAIIGDLRFALQGDPRWRHAFGATDTPSQLRNIFRVNNPIKVLVIEQAIEPRETEQVWTEATEDPSILTVVVARSVREQKRIKPTDRRIVLGPDSESGEIIDAIRTLRIRRGEKARAAFETGVLWLDPATGRVRAHNRDVKITDTEFQLLAILADQPFRLFPKDELAMTITGGTFSTLNATGGSSQDVIGNSSGNTATLTIDGGTFIGASTGTSLGIGGGPTSYLNVESGTARITTLIYNATTATVNLDGGILEVNQFTRSGGTGILNLNGGTLKARQNNSSFITGLSEVNVMSGGAIIDTNTFDITIANVLRDGGGGGGLIKNSAGTLTLTAVPTFTGTTTVNGGTLAYDLASDYTYGNTIGGAGSIVKSGAGVMTLTASNGLSGSTSITGGTLALTGSGAINSSSGITVNGSGAKFNASGSTAVSPAP